MDRISCSNSSEKGIWNASIFNLSSYSLETRVRNQDGGSVCKVMNWS